MRSDCSCRRPQPRRRRNEGRRPRVNGSHGGSNEFGLARLYQVFHWTFVTIMLLLLTDHGVVSPISRLAISQVYDLTFSAEHTAVFPLFCRISGPSVSCAV